MYSRYSNSFWEDDAKTPPMPSFTAKRDRDAPRVETAAAHSHQPSLEAAKSGNFLKNILSGFDMGDILIIVIIVFLLMESDDLEVVVALGLLLIGGL